MLIYWRLSYSALKWWGYSDLNREALRHWILNPACLPISPYPLNKTQLLKKIANLAFFYITSIMFEVKDNFWIKIKMIRLKTVAKPFLIVATN